MSKKQDIYIELLQLSMPYVRNILTRLFIFGRKRREAYELIELTHNLYLTVLHEEFTEHDIWFLNHQAKLYYVNAIKTENFKTITSLLRQLFAEVPHHLKKKLEWKGP